MLTSDVQENVTEAGVLAHVKTDHVHVSILLLPSVAIAILMLTFLSISFIRHHRQYISKRKSQLEHLNASGKRQRIGAPTCFGNSFRVSGVMPSYIVSEGNGYSSHVSLNEVVQDKDNVLPKVTVAEQKQNAYSLFSQTVPFGGCGRSESATNSRGMTESKKIIRVLKNFNSPTENRFASKLSKDLSEIAYADDSSSSPESMTKGMHISVSDTYTGKDFSNNAVQQLTTPSSECMQKSKTCDQSDSIKGSIINEKSSQPNVLGEFEVYKTPSTQCRENVTEEIEIPITHENENENNICTCEPSYSKFNRQNRRFSYLETFLHGKRMEMFRHKKISDTGENIPLRENEHNIDSFLQCRRKLSNPSISTKCLVCNKNIA